MIDVARFVTDGTNHASHAKTTIRWQGETFMTILTRCIASVVAATVCGLALSGPAQAALTLTSAGTADGFSLSTFYSGDPSNYYGLLGVTTTASGEVIAASLARNQLSLLADVDGQTPASVLLSASVPGTAFAVATAGGNTYYAAGFGGGYYRVNTTTLAVTPLTLTPPVTSYLGMWPNPVNGDLISSSGSGLVEINPLTGAVHVITASSGFDGVTVSPDGTTAYGEAGGSILAYNIAAGTLLHTYSGNGHGPDGTGVISGGAFNGDLVVNNNDGTVGLIDTGTGTETLIATGGARGDFVGPDLTNGTLFLASADQIERLSLSGATIGGGGGGGGGGTSVPEPGTVGLLGLGLAAMGLVRRRTRGHRSIAFA